MNGFLAAVKQLGNGLVYIEPLSATDPGYGHGGGSVDPDYGFGTLPHPGHGLPGYGRPDNSLPWAPVRPGQGLPSYGRPDNSLPIPPPAGVATPPIVIPAPSLPAGSGVVVPVPEGVNVPTPTGTPPAPGTKPHILWFGPGTQSSIVYVTPSTPAPAPK
jgi:hypothetical protein